MSTDATQQSVAPGSIVKIVQMRGEEFAVATYDREGACLAMKGRHFCSSYGEALLHAQLYESRGYGLRDETPFGKR